MTVLTPGQPAPDFALPTDGGGEVSLAGFAGRKLVLFFYPKADTEGCTREAVAFSALLPAFAAAGTAVVGVSPDPVRALDRFKAKHGLAVPLASDAARALLLACGVWAEKTLYGRKYMGVVRTTVLIGRDGRIVQVWPNVRVAGHAEAVLAAAQASS